MRTNHCFEGYWPIPCSCPVDLRAVPDADKAEDLRKEAS